MGFSLVAGWLALRGIVLLIVEGGKLGDWGLGIGGKGAKGAKGDKGDKRARGQGVCGVALLGAVGCGPPRMEGPNCWRQVYSYWMTLGSAPAMST